MIISASRRTDIPALYSDWFINRLDAGYLYVKNPMNSMQVSRINLSPETTDCIVFWTKNPGPMLDKLKQIKNYNYYFHFTITAYDSEIEKNLPSKQSLIETFRRLSDLTGPDRVIWRYDPVFLTERYSVEAHLDTFENIAGKLSGYAKTCMFSYLTPYNKCQKNMQLISYYVPEPQEGIKFAGSLVSIAESHAITLKSCAMKSDYYDAGIIRGRCIDPELIEKISGRVVDHSRDSSQRKECMCAPSVDIGAYNTCINGCLYCYANYNLKLAQDNYRLHNFSSELLYGTLTGNEKIYVRTQKKSFRVPDDQPELF